MRTPSTIRPRFGRRLVRPCAAFFSSRSSRPHRLPGSAAVAASAALAAVIAFAACQKKQDDSQPAATPTATGYPGYPPPQATYGQPGQYPPAPTATYGQYPAAPPQTAAPPMAPAPVSPAPPPGAPTAGGTMAVPGPLAFQCQNDVPCGTHHCNVQYGKCAFPCQSAADCISPAQCVAGLCVFPITPPH